MKLLFLALTTSLACCGAYAAAAFPVEIICTNGSYNIYYLATVPNINDNDTSVEDGPTLPPVSRIRVCEDSLCENSEILNLCSLSSDVSLPFPSSLRRKTHVNVLLITRPDRFSMLWTAWRSRRGHVSFLPSLYIDGID